MMKKFALFTGAAALTVLSFAALPASAQAGSGFSIDCPDSGPSITNGVHLQFLAAPGEYVVTAIGVDGFDPIVYAATPDDSICIDDSDQQYSADLPTASAAASGLNSQISFTNSTNEAATYDVVVAGFNNSGGEVIVLFEGGSVDASDGTGDPFAIELTPNLLDSGVALTAYVVGIDDALDPLVALVDENGDVLQDDNNNPVLCDDAGNPDLCWGESTALGGDFAGDNRDAMLSIPVDAISGGADTFFTYAVSSYQQETSGAYVFGLHFGIGDATSNSNQGNGNQGLGNNGNQGNGNQGLGSNGNQNNGNQNGSNGNSNSSALLSDGDVIDGTLPTEGVDGYQFEGAEGQTVTITMESGDFDTYLGLLDPEGTVVGENDDIEQGNTNSTLEVELPADGVYMIVATAFNIENLGDGGYQLTFAISGSQGNSNQGNGNQGLGNNGNQGNNTPPVSATVTAADSGAIELGANVQGTLDAGAENSYTLDLSGGEIITIDVQAVTNGFDPNVRIVSSTGTTIASDDDGGDGLNSRIANLQLTRAGTYTIVIGSFSGASGGQYTLTVSGRSAPNTGNTGTTPVTTEEAPAPAASPTPRPK